MNGAAENTLNYEAHPLQKKLAVHMLDGVKAESRTTCCLPRLSVRRPRTYI